MNIQQASYIAGRMVNEKAQVYAPLLSGLFAGLSIADVLVFQDYLSGIMLAGSATALRVLGVSALKKQKKVKREIEIINSTSAIIHGEIQPDINMTELSEVIVIKDITGLETILEKTRFESSREWVTFLKERNDYDEIIVYKIQAPEMDEVLKQGKNGIKFRRGIYLSYEAFHHFHPPTLFSMRCGGFEFAINLDDRIAGNSSWVNLLSFNMPYGPEIIGFDKQHTYIPVDETKRILKKATPKDIMKYLAVHTTL